MLVNVLLYLFIGAATALLLEDAVMLRLKSTLDVMREQMGSFMIDLVVEQFYYVLLIAAFLSWTMFWPIQIVRYMLGHYDVEEK